MSDEQQQQQLGGSRKGSPLSDEDCYPLTLDEYLNIKENLLLNKFTSLESVLLSIGISTLISGIIFYNTNSFTKSKIDNKINVESVDISNIIIVIIYSSVCLGAFIGLLIFNLNKRKTKTSIERLDKKIMNHLEQIEE